MTNSKSENNKHLRKDEWMDYITQEVRAACQTKGWGHQIRRKWSVREKPVWESPIEDYQWKMIPDAEGELPELPAGSIDEGVYYVLSFDNSRGKFILQHDTAHYGGMGRHMERSTYTEIHLSGGSYGVGYEDEDAKMAAQLRGTELARYLDSLPPPGWLRDHLLDLSSQFRPNTFSIT